MKIDAGRTAIEQNRYYNTAIDSAATRRVQKREVRRKVNGSKKYKKPQHSMR